MTPQDQIAYLRKCADWLDDRVAVNILAVCDLAEKHLTLTDTIGTALNVPEGWVYIAEQEYDRLIAVEERHWLTDDETEAVRRWFASPQFAKVDSTVDAVLRRLLPDERVEHRLFSAGVEGSQLFLMCSCGHREVDKPDAAVRAWAAHAGIGRTP